MKYKTLFELYKAIKSGEVSSKNTIYMGYEDIICYEEYDKHGNKAGEWDNYLFKGDTLYSQDKASEALSDFLRDSGLKVED